jgi:phosphohistidine swiveling domain-containing protein
MTSENIEYIVKRDFEGELVVLEEITANSIKSLPSNCVVYLKYPTPDIVLLFGKINGIIVHVGGKLSHFAIICREYDIPLVKYPNAKEKLENGKHITIRNGEIDVRD